jgi:hypothetical protein
MFSGQLVAFLGLDLDKVFDEKLVNTKVVVNLLN